MKRKFNLFLSFLAVMLLTLFTVSGCEVPAAGIAPIVEIKNTSATQTSLDFEISTLDITGGAITSVSLVSDDTSVSLENKTQHSIKNLKPDTEYTLKVNYSYTLDGALQTLTKELTAKTEAYEIPTVFLANPKTTKTILDFEVLEVDVDNVGEITKIELISATETKTANRNTVRRFTGLEAGTDYTLKLTYTYDVGKGDVVIEKTLDVTTALKEIPTVKVINTYKSLTSLYFEIVVDDPDFVGEMTGVGAAVQLLADGEVWGYTENLEDYKVSATKYHFDSIDANSTLYFRATYTYDLGDGNGEKTVIAETVASTYSIPEIKVINASAAYNSITFEISELDENNLAEITEIAIIDPHGNEVLADSLDQRRFDELLEGTEYTVRITYDVDLGNDVTESFTSSAKIVTLHTEHIDDDRDGFCDINGCTEQVECTHEDEDGDDVCDFCYEVLIQPGNYPWEKTTLKFALNMHSHNGELSSGSKRYLAGFADGTDLVKEVGKRNAKAAYYTKTAITYEYWSDQGDSAEHDWGDSNAYIAQLLKGGSNQPDMYSTFLYDMMCASLDKSFANLKTSQADNYFAFANDPYYIDTVGDSEGYMMWFMESLTLSSSKMYLLASDYFIDTVRAFFIVPVNVDMLNALGASVKTELGGTLPETGAFADRTGDGEFTIEDFIELVWAREWTYEAIQQFSEKVYQDADGDGLESAKDILGFVLESSSGFSSRGVVYTSSISIIDKYMENGTWNYCYPAVEMDATTGNWTFNPDLYSYASAEALFQLESNVTALFQATGVFASTNAMSDAYGMTTYERELVAIKHKFTSSENSLLFGGFILTGNLDEVEAGDYNDYQDMRRFTNGGFAIAPTPLYAAIGADEQYTNPAAENYRDYQTLIHNTARLGAISVNTKKFAQCSAFLDYQSKNSTDILEEYYQEKLCRAAGSENDNSEVMEFIRDHVRSIFDMALEDAIGYFYSAHPAAAKKWHDMIKVDNFQPDGTIAASYSTIATRKQALLIELQGEYQNLPELKYPEAQE